MGYQLWIEDEAKAEIEVLAETIQYRPRRHD
jgi:hypothetical protein